MTKYRCTRQDQTDVTLAPEARGCGFEWECNKPIPPQVCPGCFRTGVFDVLPEPAAEVTPRQRAETALTELGLTIKAEFVPLSRSCNKDEKYPSLNWRVSIFRELPDHEITRRVPVLTTDYMVGCGHTKAYRASVKDLGNSNCTMRRDAINKECETGIGWRSRELHKPDATDVFYSLVMDSDALDAGSFEDWASDHGYDADSRKAEATYRVCLEIALKLRGAIGDAGLNKLRESFQDY